MENSSPAKQRPWIAPGNFQTIIAFLLALLFSYAALSKSLNFNRFRAQLLVQPFPPFMAHLLAFLLPVLELSAAALLCFRSTAYAGFWLALILMVEFTGYVALTVMHFWRDLPCSCGGILGNLSWGPHLVFNLFFLAITIIGLYITHQERRPGDH